MTNSSSMEGFGGRRFVAFHTIREVCDGGGGHSLLLALILQRNPGVGGVLFDQSQVIEEARRQPVPAGMDAYVSKRIVHDGSDARFRFVFNRTIIQLWSIGLTVNL